MKRMNQRVTLKWMSAREASFFELRQSWLAIGGMLLSLTLRVNFAAAQSGSLFRSETESDVRTPEQLAMPQRLPGPVSPNGDQPVLPPVTFGNGIPLQAASFTYQAPASLRRLNIHDIVSIRVDELATASMLGNAQSRKNGSYDARLSDWLDWVSFDTIKPAPMTGGDPRVAGQTNETYRAQSNLQTREQLTFNIAAEIADIRPNGTIVLSARKTLRLNDNVMKISFSGVCRSQDIGPDNTVLSRNVFDTHVDKQEDGQVRDGYSRGFVAKWFARFKPF
jgi:flagellar L-ring protein precursor FlgH